MSVISVKEARKLIGSSAAELNDTQIEELINTMSLLAKEFFKKSGSKK